MRAAPPNETAFVPSPGTVAPVRQIPGDSARDEPADEIGLCLSGGGYRAMLFHVGALWRLNDVGALPRLARISSVSGGSIAAAVLALAWSDLGFHSTTGVAAHFAAKVVTPLRRLASMTIDVLAILEGLISAGGPAPRVASAYRKHLGLGRKTLQDLPEAPRFVFNATSLQSGVLWRFSRPYLADYRVGRITRPRLSLATAVAASAAFPPFLSPLKLRFQAGELEDQEHTDLHRPPYTRRAVLTDGGVYDNLGLETVWKRCRRVLASDGGGRMGAVPKPWENWFAQFLRVREIHDDQVRDLRKRQLIESYRLPEGAPGWRRGAYWGIWTPFSKYPRRSDLPCPEEATTRLAMTPTRLRGMPTTLQERLVNWGYAACDAGLRSYYPDLAGAMPGAFPYASTGV